MSKTKKINNRRRKNKTRKTRKTRMMMGGTITMSGNKFVALNNKTKNVQQAKFYNEYLPNLFGLHPNNASELIDFLKNPELDNEPLPGEIGMEGQLEGNYSGNYGLMAYISSHERLPGLGNIINAFIDRKLGTLETTNDKRELLQKIKNVQESLKQQIEKRKEEEYETNHDLYANTLRAQVAAPVQNWINRLTAITEEAGEIKEQNNKSLNNGILNLGLFAPLGDMALVEPGPPSLAQQQHAFATGLSNPLGFLDKFNPYEAEEEQATKKSPAPPAQQQTCPQGWETQPGFDNFCFKWYNHPNVADSNQTRAAELIKNHLFENHQIKANDVIITTGQSQCKPGFKIGIKNLKDDIPELSEKFTEILGHNSIPVLERQCKKVCKTLIDLFFPGEKNDENSIGKLLKKLTKNKCKKVRIFLQNQSVGKCKLTEPEIDNFIRILGDLNEIYNPTSETKSDKGTNLLSHLSNELYITIFLKVKAIVDFVSYYPDIFFQGGNKKRKIKTKKRKIFRQRKKKPKTRKIDRYKKTIKTK